MPAIKERLKAVVVIVCFATCDCFMLCVNLLFANFVRGKTPSSRVYVGTNIRIESESLQSTLLSRRLIITFWAH
jgi:hypothetical protein